MAEATRGTVERTVVTQEPSIRLELSESEALTLRILLYVTQLGGDGHGANASALVRALEAIDVSIDEELSDAIFNGEVIQKASLDTGIYWV